MAEKETTSQCSSKPVSCCEVHEPKEEYLESRESNNENFERVSKAKGAEESNHLESHTNDTTEPVPGSSNGSIKKEPSDGHTVWFPSTTVIKSEDDESKCSNSEDEESEDEVGEDERLEEESDVEMNDDSDGGAYHLAEVSYGDEVEDSRKAEGQDSDSILGMSLAKKTVIVMKKNEASKPNARKNGNESSRNIKAQMVISKRTKLKEHEKETTLEQSQENRNIELDKLCKVSFCEIKVDMEQEEQSGNLSIEERKKELWRQRSQRYRDRKRLQRLDPVAFLQEYGKEENSEEEKLLRKKELARIRCRRFRERQKLIEKDKSSRKRYIKKDPLSIERARQLSRQRSKKVQREKKTGAFE